MDSNIKCYNIMTPENQICFTSIFYLNLNLKYIFLCVSRKTFNFIFCRHFEIREFSYKAFRL